MIKNFIKDILCKFLFSYDYDIVIDENACQPTRAYQNDAGYDLYTNKSFSIKPNEMCNISTGIAVKSKRSAWFLMTSRSSTLPKYGIMVEDGVIDGDYTGELFIKVYNTTKSVVVLPPHTRIAQIIVLPHTIVKFHQVGKLDVRDNKRGTKGFGSSGV